MKCRTEEDCTGQARQAYLCQVAYLLDGGVALGIRWPVKALLGSELLPPSSVSSSVSVGMKRIREDGIPETSLKARAVSSECLSVYLHNSLSVILSSNPVCRSQLFAAHVAYSCPGGLCGTIINVSQNRELWIADAATPHTMSCVRTGIRR